MLAGKSSNKFQTSDIMNFDVEISNPYYSGPSSIAIQDTMKAGALGMANA